MLKLVVVSSSISAIFESGIQEEQCSILLKEMERKYLAKFGAVETASDCDDASLNTTDGHGGVDETGDTDTGNETGRDGVHETLVGLGAGALPDLTRGPTNEHGDGNGGRGVDEAETDGVQVDPVGLEAVRDEFDADNDVDDGQDAADDGEDHGSVGDSTITGQNLADVSPSNDGGDEELALGNRLVEDTGVGLGVEQEERNSNGNSKGRADQLSPQHGTGGGTDQVTSLEISDHVDGLGADRGSNVGAHEVGLLNNLDIRVGDTGEDQLGDLGDGTGRVDIGLAGGLETDKGEEKGDDDGSDGGIDGDMEVKVHDQDGEDTREEKSADPPAGRDELMLGGGVLGDVAGLVDKGLLFREFADKVATFLDSGHDGVGERLAVGTELREGSKDHHTDTGPEEPGLGRTDHGWWEETSATGQVTS